MKAIAQAPNSPLLSFVSDVQTGPQYEKYAITKGTKNKSIILKGSFLTLNMK